MSLFWALKSNTEQSADDHTAAADGQFSPAPVRNTEAGRQDHLQHLEDEAFFAGANASKQVKPSLKRAASQSPPHPAPAQRPHLSTDYSGLSANEPEEIRVLRMQHEEDEAFFAGPQQSRRPARAKVDSGSHAIAVPTSTSTSVATTPAAPSTSVQADVTLSPATERTLEANRAFFSRDPAFSSPLTLLSKIIVQAAATPPTQSAQQHAPQPYQQQQSQQHQHHAQQRDNHHHYHQNVHHAPAQHQYSSSHHQDHTQHPRGRGYNASAPQVASQSSYRPLKADSAHAAQPLTALRFAFVMRGIPGSGKSTVARQLAGERGVVVSADNYMVDEFGVYEFSRERLGECHSRAQVAFEDALRNQTPVVVMDNTGMTRREVDPHVALATRYSYVVSVVTLPMPSVDVAVSRNLHGVSRETILAMMARWEP